MVLVIHKLFACWNVKLTDSQNSPILMGIAHLGFVSHNQTYKLAISDRYLIRCSLLSTDVFIFFPNEKTFEENHEIRPPGQAQPQKDLLDNNMLMPKMIQKG